MKVLQVGLSHNPGGVESFVMNYYREMIKYSVQFDFICMYTHLAYEEEICTMGGKIYYTSNVKRHPIRFSKELTKILENEKYDIIHVNMLSAANIVPLVIGRKQGIKKVIAHSHNSSTPGIMRNILHYVNKPRIKKFATDYFSCSHLAGQWLFTEEMMNQEKFHIIHNALKLEKFAFHENERAELRERLQIKDKFVIGHVGRFEEQKNHDFLIKIFRSISEVREDAILLLIGDGELKEKTAAAVEAYGLKNRVHFLGVRNDINQVWKAVDFFVLPSLFEGLPLVALEAQASGVYSVMADTISKEVQITERVAFLSLAQSADEWKNHILKYAGYERRESDNVVIKECFKKAGYEIVAAGKQLLEYYKV